MYWTDIFNWTSAPSKSPSFVALCSWGNVTDTLTASTLVFVIWRVTGVLLVTSTPTLVVDTLLSIPGIFVWLPVPKRGVNFTSWKLKSVVWGSVESAEALSTGVSLRNTSLSAALLYAVVPFVLPSFEAVAKPSI